MTSRKRILFGCYAMVLAIIGDYLLGFETFSMSDSPDAYMGMTANVAPDWRYALSSVLGFICAALFAYAAVELLSVMEKRYRLNKEKLFKLFKIANWGGILYFAFIHIGICMLQVVFNAGMEATGDMSVSIGMALRVAKSIAVPLAAGFIICDVFVMIAWVGLILKGKLPLKKIAVICNPVIMVLVGQLMNVIKDGLDSGFESLGWLLMYLVCAMKLAGKEAYLA